MESQKQHFIANTWVEGQGEYFAAHNPMDETIIWEGKSASETQIDETVQAAKQAFTSWSRLSFSERLKYLTRFQENLRNKRYDLARKLSENIGKPLWEANSEIGSTINKLNITIEAFNERSPSRFEKELPILQHKPHGAVAIFAPFNFPVHVAHGHILPALLAGNTVVLKPSELTPCISEHIMECWHEAKLPPGVINMVQGGADVGKQLSHNPLIDGLFFTGSTKTGINLLRQFSASPQKILALEMGGNNPLVVHELGAEIEAAVYQTIQSAYITSGQRCTCARRLIVTRTKQNGKFIKKLSETMEKIKIAAFNSEPEPFMGPLVSKGAMNHVFSMAEKLIKHGAKPLVEPKKLGAIGAFLSPSLLDVTDIHERADEEIFGPVLQLIWVNDLDEAIQEANNTAFGLVAGLLSVHKNNFEHFYNEVRAGLINWNKPLTGASSHSPFGGIGKSGNFRPSGYYAVDYCAYPVASLCDESLTLPSELTPGIVLE